MSSSEIGIDQIVRFFVGDMLGTTIVLYVPSNESKATFKFKES
jgi:hypothetical protein